jgi:hypothetical protein
VLAALTDLPSGIGLVDARTLVPVMAAIPGQLNYLTAEAVAAAIIVDGKIAVTTQSKPLTDTAEAVGIDVEFVASGIYGAERSWSYGRQSRERHFGRVNPSRRRPGKTYRNRL